MSDDIKTNVRFWFENDVPRPAPASGDLISREAAIAAVYQRWCEPESAIATLRALPSVSVTEEQFQMALSELWIHLGEHEEDSFVASEWESALRAVIAALGLEVGE